MVAKITFPKRVEATLNYNENKVEKGTALCLAANGYLREADDLNFYQKLDGLRRNHSLNERANTKTLHVSLNFDPSEKLSNERLIAIANLYMEKIGFGEQPYLIYRHEDAGHPHIHIVSTTIQDNGRRINTHNIGRHASEKARKEIELQFGLIKAEGRQKKEGTILKPVPVEKAIYGKEETKRAISTIVTAIFHHYRFTSLPEYNAALRQFNVVADRGKEGGRIYRNSGLVYRLLDEQGNKVGVPIKASLLSCCPTLSALEKKFIQNEVLKTKGKPHLKNLLDATLPAANSLQQLREQLLQHKVFVLPRQNSEGKIYGITFVDNHTKCVFNGSDLGKEYSAAAIQSRLSANQMEIERQVEEKHKNTSHTSGLGKKEYQMRSREEVFNRGMEKAIDRLITPKEQYDNVPTNLLNKKRKRKKRRNPNSSL